MAGEMMDTRRGRCMPYRPVLGRKTRTFIFLPRIEITDRWCSCALVPPHFRDPTFPRGVTIGVTANRRLQSRTLMLIHQREIESNELQLICNFKLTVGLSCKIVVTSC